MFDRDAAMFDAAMELWAQFDWSADASRQRGKSFCYPVPFGAQASEFLPVVVGLRPEKTEQIHINGYHGARWLEVDY